MAIGRGAKLSNTQKDESGYLSDESDFYGDEATVQELEHRAATFDVAEWWANKKPSLTEVANAGMAERKVKSTVTLYNLYQGPRYRDCARQLEETVVEFLARLPPATTRVSSVPYRPWIYIANPYRKAPSPKEEGVNHVKEKFDEEGPADEERDLEKFIPIGNDLLEELRSIQHVIEKQKAGEAKVSITRAVNVEKERIVREILNTATELHVTSGKWMMFCSASEVNEVWSVVARATAENEIGTAAKVGPDAGDGKERLICIYTKDFNDMEDVTRVLQKMKNLGLFQLKERPLYYKCNAYTYLNLTSTNPFNIKASLYNSKDVLASKAGNKGQTKLDGLLYKRKEDSGDWRELEQW